MRALANVVRQTIEREHLLLPGESVIIALSGGADSVALLRVLFLWGYTVTAAHCNFRLRGTESDTDELYVQDLCRRMNIPLHIKHFGTADYARRLGCSIEMAARELRYNWFSELSRELGIEKIALAHHRNDQAETILLNLSMGTGIRGLGGMRYIRDGHFIRPLLDVSRKEIESFLTKEDIAYRTDSTNASTEYKRNAIRHQIVPEFELLNPSFVDAVCRTGKNLSEAEDLLNILLHQIDKECRTGNDYLIAPLLQYPSHCTILYKWLHPYGFNRLQCEDIAASLHRPAGAVFISNTHRLVRGQKKLELLPKENVSELLPIPIKMPDATQSMVTIELPHGMVTCEMADAHTTDIHPNACKVYFDAEHFPENPIFAPIKSGERIKPYGMPGSRKVSKVFIDHHLERSLRKEFYALYASDCILWLPALLRSAHYPITNKTQRLLIFSFAPRSKD